MSIVNCIRFTSPFNFVKRCLQGILFLLFYTLLWSLNGENILGQLISFVCVVYRKKYVQVTRHKTLKAIEKVSEPELDFTSRTFFSFSFIEVIKEPSRWMMVELFNIFNAYKINIPSNVLGVRYNTEKNYIKINSIRNSRF